MSLGYMWEVFHVGTRTLASGVGRIQSRLEGAFLYMHGRLTGPNEGLPADLAARAREVCRRVTCVPAKGDEGTIAATCRVMSDEEAVQIAQEVVDLYDKVCELHAVESDREDRRWKK